MAIAVDPGTELQALQDAAIESADSPACDSLLANLRRLRGWIDAVEARVTSRMRELHSAEGAPSPAYSRATTVCPATSASGAIPSSAAP